MTITEETRAKLFEDRYKIGPIKLMEISSFIYRMPELFRLIAFPKRSFLLSGLGLHSRFVNHRAGIVKE